ncbi:MAG: hypothetical protein OHK0046_06680 [Anaerolineae bacterium]
MSEAYKICPICRASNHRSAAICHNCGASLHQVEAVTAQSPRPTPTNLDYDFRYGEADLYESDLNRIGRRYLTAIFTLLVAVMLGGLLLAFSPSFFPELLSSSAPLPTDTPTLRPTLAFPTVTLGPPTLTATNTQEPSPTPTQTFTPEPCIRSVQANDTLYGLANSCGHLSFDVLNLIVELNDSLDTVDTPLQIGQQIIIPWPTTTPDPNAVATQAPTDSAALGEEGQTEVSAFDENFDPLFVPTATLRPDVMIHTVLPDENIISIAFLYGANVEILSQLNPEITFSQCDFGVATGGPRCTVQIFQGQQIRVPAPTPTPTLPPTLTGSETPSPTPTATFNAPVLQSPSDRANFLRDQIITLRWSPTGTLNPSQTYLVWVEDLTAGIVYTAETLDTSFIIPAEWQGTAEPRHEFAWMISIIDAGQPENTYFTTSTLTFTWEGRS